MTCLDRDISAGGTERTGRDFGAEYTSLQKLSSASAVVKAPPYFFMLGY
jgi:hypothetical protein